MTLLRSQNLPRFIGFNLYYFEVKRISAAKCSGAQSLSNVLARPVSAYAFLLTFFEAKEALVAELISQACKLHRRLWKGYTSRTLIPTCLLLTDFLKALVLSRHGTLPIP